MKWTQPLQPKLECFQGLWVWRALYTEVTVTPSSSSLVLEVKLSRIVAAHSVYVYSTFVPVEFSSLRVLVWTHSLVSLPRVQVCRA